MRKVLSVVALVAATAVMAACSVESDSGGSGDSASAGVDASESADTSEASEVTITRCNAPDSIGIVYVEGEAANGSSKRSDYIVEVAIVTPDGTQIGTGTTFVTNVESGQKALWKALTDTDETAAQGDYTCKIVDVERNASL